MSVNPETPHETGFQLLTGHFEQRKGYRAWRERGTNDWLLIYTLEGRGRFGYGTGELVMETGDAVFLKPHTLHDCGVEARLEYGHLLWVHFRPRAHWTAYLQLPEVAPGLLRLHVPEPERSRIETRLAEVHALATGGQGRREDFAMNALEETLLVLDILNPEADRTLDPRVARAQTLLRERLAGRVTLPELAAACHLSGSRLSHLFREQTGTTPLQFLEAERLERAKRLLELTPMTVQDVAAEVGFESPFYFTRRFRRYTGRSPQAFRQTVRDTPEP